MRICTERYGGDGDGSGVGGSAVGVCPGGVEVAFEVGAGEVEGVGSGTPSMLAMSLRILVISAFVSHSGYFGGTMRSCLTDAFWAFPNRSTRLGSDSRGRSVQTKPFAALNSAGALKMVSAPI